VLGQRMAKERERIEGILINNQSCTPGTSGNAKSVGNKIQQCVKLLCLFLIQQLQQIQS
jgi:hypothetical protein